ncbi:MAG: hypothetical protein K2H30_03470 [Clostridia bacterium]|nr:hypothetical protein [Clostridia bacterium]MDE7264871.1 hypothetical protein [Clostridia bacterium]
MRQTSLLCVIMLITLGICGGVYAFSGFNLLFFLCFKTEHIYRSFLAVCSVAAIYTIYALFAFKPFRGLK